MQCCYLNTTWSEGCSTEQFTAGREKAATLEETADHRIDKGREKTGDSKCQVFPHYEGEGVVEISYLTRRHATKEEIRGKAEKVRVRTMDWREAVVHDELILSRHECVVICRPNGLEHMICVYLPSSESHLQSAWGFLKFFFCGSSSCLAFPLPSSPPQLSSEARWEQNTA